MSEIQQQAWLLSFLAQVCLAVVITRRQLPYPFFRAWLWASVIRTGILRVAGNTNETPYIAAYLVTEPILLALLAAVVMELFHQRASGLVMVGRTGTILFTVLVGVAAVVTALTFLSGSQAPREAALASIIALRRTALTLMLAFLAATLFFFYKFPAPGRLNLLIHHILLTVNIAGPVAAIIGIWFDPLHTHHYNTIALTCTSTSFLAWLVLLRRQGEREPALIGQDKAEAIERSAGELVDELRSAAKSARRPRD
ncbi:MAG: hypothetical protein R2762_10700 [Bryobacteraceae bacterium]